ncbi:hypothetical protein [Thalassobaculum sp.]|uniref:hypothetical protein n=1 Tax=Thalassobaculum sp. TaxID=2022740 RepID=UPI0032EFD767
MNKFRVTAPLGVRIPVGAVVALSPEQAAKRAGLLRPGDRRGQFVVVAPFDLKCGEAFGVDDPRSVSLQHVEPADRAAAKPAEGKPAEGKPAEGKPAEGRPAEGKPAEGRPAEGKPAEGKPAEGKPAEGKPADPTEPPV